MPLSTPLLQFLKRGNFPLTDSGGLRLWDELITALEANAAAAVGEAKAAMTAFKQDFSDCFSPELTVNNVTIDTGQDEIEAFMGAAHARLCDNFAVAHLGPLQGLIQRLRVLMGGPTGLPESSVVLGLDPNHLMGNGLVANPLTCLPDPAWGVTFGSTPDQALIGQAAPMWNILKRRAFEARGVLTRYGAKPHYVLAHLLNHNLNGPGDEERNVVPFWATANTAMAKQAECYVKELVQNGVQVSYTVHPGPAVGMTPGRQAALALCDPAQAEVIDCEQYLPAYLRIECSALDASGSWVPVVAVTIDNYVPETVPYLI